jgi:hypothetical protein
LGQARNSHCPTSKPQMTYLVFLPAFVARITDPHECISILQVQNKGDLTYCQEAPMPSLPSTVSMPGKQKLVMRKIVNT